MQSRWKNSFSQVLKLFSLTYMTSPYFEQQQRKKLLMLNSRKKHIFPCNNIMTQTYHIYKCSTYTDEKVRAYLSYIMLKHK